MTRTLRDALRTAVRRYDLLATGDTVLVAVSGGPDSVALLAALHELRAAFGIAVVAGHLDHGLRGAESAADRACVEHLATELGVALRTATVRLPGGNLEAEARRARYAFLERAAAELGATKIATGHTLDDQAETVLLRLLRGAGRRGLGGIPPRRGHVIRPLILCDRVQVRHFLVERGLAWRVDRSNFDYGFERTRVRAGYLPALARELNPRLARTLGRLADLLREEDTLLDRMAAMAAGRRPSVDLAVLRALEPPLARRAVRHWWRRHGSGRRLGLAHTEAVLALARREQGGGEVGVPGGAVVREGAALRFRPAADGGEPAPAPYALRLAPGETLTLPGGWRLRLAEHVPPTLTIRSRRPGDRMRPLGLAGRTTVKRLLIARGVPRAMRAGYPLVLAGDEIVWVPGCARGTRALLSPASRRVLVLTVEAAPGAMPGAASAAPASC
jgi:tRNA(Ile)-lysidine synthase